MSVVEMPYKGEGPLPLVREVPSGEPYPYEALGPLQAVAEAVHDMTQAPIGIAAQSALAVVSLAVQGFADVETLGADTPCSLFCLTIAESGERKSGCDRLLMKGVRDHEKELGEVYREDVKAYNLAHKIWSEKYKRLIAESAGANKDKAAVARLELDELGPEPKAPLLPQLTAMEPTFEGLLKLYHTGYPSLGLFTDEGGGFVGGHAMNSDNRLKTMAGLSRLWNGEPIDRIRVGDGVSVYRGRRLASHLMMQQIVAYRFVSDPEANGQGFLARFLICEPTSHIGFRLRRGYSQDSKAITDRFAERVRDVLASPAPNDGNPQELAPRRLPLSSPARDLLWRFYEAVEKGQAPGKEFEQVRAHASKAAEQAARIAGVLTLWADINAAAVTPEAMVSGVTLANYYLSEAKRLADVGAITVETAETEALRKWLMESWRHPDVVAKDVLQYGPSTMRESAKAKSAMKTLEKHGWLTRLPEGAVIRGQARKEAYRITGKSHAI